MIDINNLNERQKEAVLSNDDRIIVLAGAGSGKTKVLTTRIARLIDEGTDAENILALTFTNKASEEMKERISKAVGIDKKRINAMTFHSFAVKVLKKHIEQLELGYTKNFRICDSEEIRNIVLRVLRKRNLNEKDYNNYIEARNKYTHTRMREFLKGQLKEIVDEINNTLLQNNSLTFDDLIYYLSETFKVEDVLNEYQEKFKYVLVDEFQDTDFTQYDILKKLTEKSKHLFVVGDDYQAIYSFRGANSKVVFKFLEDYPNHKLVKLEQNYRSTPEILDLANTAIKNNRHQIDKTLFTENKSGLTPVLFNEPYDSTEARRVVSYIKQLKSKGIKYSDMTILYRLNVLSRIFEDELKRENIPYVVYNGVSFYQREEIKDIVAYLNLIANKYNNESFRRIINKPYRKCALKMIDAIEKCAKKNQGEKYSMFVESKNFTLCKDFYNVIAIAKIKYHKEEIKTIRELIDYVVFDVKYQDYVLSKEESDDNDRMENIEEFKNIADAFEHDNDKTLFESREDYLNYFLQTVSVMMNTDYEKDKDKDAVNLMTIHASKGLEFNVVFMPALEEDIFPSKKIKTGDELEEERRLFYVGVTRAKRYLFLSCAEKRKLYGNLLYEMKSRFLYEVENKVINS